MPRQKSTAVTTDENENDTKNKTAATGIGQNKSEKTDAVSLLKADHRTVDELFTKAEDAESSEKKKIVRKICQELVTHTQLEEEIFYPACREHGVETSSLDEAQVEHDGAKVMINELLQASPEDEFYDAKVTVLKEYIKHHVAEEEKPRGGIFAQARKAGVDLDALGQKIKARKEQIAGAAGDRQNGTITPPQYRSLHLQTQSSENKTMAGQQGSGRYGSRGSEYGSGRHSSSDNYQSGSGNQGGRNRNESRFGRDDSDRYGSQQYRQQGNSGNRWNQSDDDQYGNSGSSGYSSGNRNRQQSQEGNWRNRDQNTGGYGNSSSYDRDESRYSGGQNTGSQYGSQYGENQYGGQSSHRDRDWDQSSRSRSGQSDWEGNNRSSQNRDQDDYNRSSRRSGAGYGTSYDQDSDQREGSRGSRSRSWSDEDDFNETSRSGRSWQDR